MIFCLFLQMLQISSYRIKFNSFSTIETTNASATVKELNENLRTITEIHAILKIEPEIRCLPYLLKFLFFEAPNCTKSSTELSSYQSALELKRQLENIRDLHNMDNPIFSVLNQDFIVIGRQMFLGQI